MPITHAYTPGLTVSESVTLRKLRRLPLPGKVHVAQGQAVAAADIVASSELPGNVATVNVAHDLNVSPEEMPRCMAKAEDDPVQVGDVIAEYKALWGIFHSLSQSPVDGIVENISNVTGQVLIRGKPLPVEVTAYVNGTVVEVLGDEGVVVECHGALLQGIIGIGGEAHGRLKLLAATPDQILEAEHITDECQGKIVVGGSLATYAALQRACEVGVTGVIVGGIRGDDLDGFLGEPLGVAITGQEDIGITLVITEGFGQITMAQRSFELLLSHDGQAASINGATQIRAGVIRPEVIIPHTGAEAVLPPSAVSALAVGSCVRLIREPYFGLLGTVTDLPEQLQIIETEAQVRVARVKLEDGGEVTVPRANIELIQQ